MYIWCIEYVSYALFYILHRIYILFLGQIIPVSPSPFLNYFHLKDNISKFCSASLSILFMKVVDLGITPWSLAYTHAPPLTHNNTKCAKLA